MAKKLTILGKGMAGSYTASHFARHSDLEIDLYFDPNTRVQSIALSGNINLPIAMDKNARINYSHLPLFDGTFKMGVTKLNWGNGEPLGSWFRPGITSYHFSGEGLQNLILDQLGNRINVIPQRVDINDIDSDFIMDCTGKPTDPDKLIYLNEKEDSIPVDSVLIIDCPWDFPIYNTTHSVARPYGWVFAIPLASKMSVGYLYNKSINTLDEVKEDIKEVFKQLAITPGDKSVSFSFDSYYRKQNFTGRIAYNGNQSAFLEPLEATSIWLMTFNQLEAMEVWLNNKPIDEANKLYQSKVAGIETCVMLHYFAGSIFDTDFWRFAKERSERHMRNAIKNPEFQLALRQIATTNLNNPGDVGINEKYGHWAITIWGNHFKKWGIFDKLKKLYV